MIRQKKQQKKLQKRIHQMRLETDPQNKTIMKREYELQSKKATNSIRQIKIMQGVINTIIESQPNHVYSDSDVMSAVWDAIDRNEDLTSEGIQKLYAKGDFAGNGLLRRIQTSVKSFEDAKSKGGQPNGKRVYEKV